MKQLAVPPMSLPGQMMREVFGIAAVPDYFAGIAAGSELRVFDGEDSGEFFVGDLDGGNSGGEGVVFDVDAADGGDEGGFVGVS